ncbi:2'-5' RNA ligase family protein [Terrabacter aerolatus]|uniref:2'-5' RNA ligase n=1 Tax=Terrabacter aerolatus TaxID=422442 RepID=A0A512D572_9MICO|nr:2'-5' RNA ligase family protein [Terrabacter aerolatus]GEO31608.1 2'-5' RNA ligase [Terrabacter aerolatus]
MALALCLLLDPASDRLVRALWRRLEEQGVPTLLTHTHGRHVPHVSYAVLLAAERQAVLSAAAGLGDELDDEGPLGMAVQGVVVFPRGRAALAGSTTAALATRQARAVEALRATGAVIHRHYEPGHWMPHVSLTTGVAGARLPSVVEAVSDRLPLTLRCDRAAIIDTTDGTTWELTCVP